MTKPAKIMSAYSVDLYRPRHHLNTVRSKSKFHVFDAVKHLSSEKNDKTEQMPRLI